MGEFIGNDHVEFVFGNDHLEQAIRKDHVAERNIRHGEKEAMEKNGNEGKVVMRGYDNDNTRDDEGARGYLPPGLRGAVGKGSPLPDEDNRLLSCFLMKPGIRINQD